MPPIITVLIPARDEEAHLPTALSALQAARLILDQSLAFQAQPDVALEIIVIANRCTDRTEEIALAHGCLVVRDESKNLAKIRNTGARAARGDILITLDADSIVAPNILVEIFRALSRSDTVGGGVMIYPERISLGILCTGLMLLPVALLHRISAGVFFCRRADFFAIGGFDETLFSAEDIDFAKRLRAHGALTGRRFRTLFRTSIITSCRKFDHFGDWHFVRHPKLFWSLLRGRNVSGANSVWYDFPR